MRRRRAQRCLLRAEVAVQAGFVDDARAALEEARALDAPAEEIARIEALIAAPAAAPVVDKPRLGWKPLAAAALIVLAASIFGFGALWQDAPAAVPTAQAADAAPPPVVPNETVQNVPVRVDDVIAVPTTGVASEPEASDASESSAVAASAREPSAAVDFEASERADPLPAARVTMPEPVALSSTLPVPRSGLALPPPEPDPSTETTTREASAAAARVVPPAVDPVPALAAAPAPRDESADVRAVLARYENAYSRLDTSEARAVWPDVDERALSRAFSSLVSQRVSLGRCDVALNGGSARATCVGTATWTPKVGGGGSRTEARRWTFDLRKSGDAWRIERATAR